MAGPAYWLLEYAAEHLLISVAVAVVAYAAMRANAVPARAHAALMLVAFVAVVAGPVVPFPANAPTAPAHAAMFDRAAADAGLGAPASAPSAATAPAPGHRRAAIAVAPEWAVSLVALWLAGAAWRLGRLAVAHARVRRLMAASRRCRALEHAYRDAVPAGIAIRVSPAFGPAVVGLLRPTIVLPRAMAASLPSDSLRAVLLHEATHIGRRDMPVLLLQRVVEAVFWWNPVLRPMGAAFDAAREIACDIRAARAYGAPIEYAEALLASVEHLAAAMPTPHRAAHALCATASLATLERRIDAIIQTPPASRWPATAAAAAVGVALVALGIAADAAAPRISLQRPVAAARPASARPVSSPPVEMATLADAHDRYVRTMSDVHAQYTETLHRLSDGYTRGLAVIEDTQARAMRGPRLARLNHDYGRALSAAQSRYRDAAIRAETAAGFPPRPPQGP